MKVPKETNDYCKKCNKHTLHKMKVWKSGRARGLARGQRRNVEKKKGIKGKYQFTATVRKQTKKATFIAECSECKAKHYFVIPKRMKKIEVAN